MKDEIKDKIIGILNKYSKTDLEWMAGFHGKDCRVIDFMDYHKVADEIASLKSQLSEAGEEKKECSSCQWVKIGYGHCEWCLRNTSYNNELSLKTSGYADNWQPR